ncbi:restriction endonuclease subunit S [Lysinibacillus sp. LZ02]|uniref:restriction endonuclease subunit S n=1 Tax=Lysinibacillus sp. LZ02 TaxID=3420668 RepID=UPI003D360DBA
MSEVREGYKMTELGEIPSEWEVVSFKNCCSIVSGLVDPNEEKYKEYPHIGNANIEKESGKLLKYNLVKDENLISGKFLFNEKHVLYGKINPHFAKAAYPMFGGLCSADMYPIETNLEILIPEYLLYLILDNRFTKAMTANSARTGIPKVNKQEMDSYKFILPTIEEQQKISSILSTVDEQIDETQQLIVKTKELKKGLMQQLLTKGIGHTEFKQTELGEIPLEWNIYVLEEIVTILDGMRKPIKKNDRKPGKIPYYGATGVIDWVDNYIFEEQLILVGEDGENLRSRVLPMAFKIHGKTWVNNHAHVLKPNQNINIDYLTYYLESIDYDDYITGSAQPKLNQAQLKKIKTLIPTLQEQQKIASILSTVDAQIEVYEQEKVKYEELKKGLMQQLLTGQVRVKI